MTQHKDSQGKGLWPDGSGGVKVVWVCPACGRVENSAFGLRAMTEPVYCNQHHRLGRTDQPPYETWEGFPVMHEVEVLPASLSEELADHLSNCLAVIDGEQRVGPDNEAREFLSEYRKAVGR